MDGYKNTAKYVNGVLIVWRQLLNLPPSLSLSRRQKSDKKRHHLPNYFVIPFLRLYMVENSRMFLLTCQLWARILTVNLLANMIWRVEIVVGGLDLE
jgi:hypothetical protein